MSSNGTTGSGALVLRTPVLPRLGRQSRARGARCDVCSWLTSGPAGDEDRPVGSRSDRAQVVVAGQDLDLEARVLGVVSELVSRDQVQGVHPGPAGRGRAG